MKAFEDICRMTQREVKSYMNEYLTENGYNVVSEDGFLYAKGEHPVLLVAHLDTVHKKLCETIEIKDGILTSPEGIGGDDRCGVFIIMNLVKETKCSVLLCEDEEIGTVGAKKFTKATYKKSDEEPAALYVENLDVNYMIEFDRKSNKDAVFYSCDNKDFEKFVTEKTGFVTAWGSFTDISTLMPASKLAAVNLSCGYYNPHQTTEYVVYNEMLNTIEVAKKLIAAECEQPFKYVAKVYTWTKEWNGGWESSYSKKNKKKNGKKKKAATTMEGEFINDIFGLTQYADKGLYETALRDKELELEVICKFVKKEEVYYVQGNSKTECWMNFFLENPDICFNDVVDYSWC